MSSDETPPQPSREELVIALLMGELEGPAAEEIEATIENDRRLKEFHRRMQRTLGFVQEAVAAPEISKAPTPLKLSEERRGELLTKFRVVKMEKSGQPTTRKWRSRMVEVAVVIAIIGILIGMTMPSLKNVGLSTQMAEPSSGMYAMETGEANPLNDAKSKAGADGAKTTTVQLKRKATASSPVAATTAPAPPAPPSGLSVAHFVDMDLPTDGVPSDRTIDLGTPDTTIRLRNIRTDPKKSARKAATLDIVLPDTNGERDEQDARGQFFASVPKYQSRWEDQAGLASRDGEKAAIESIVPAEVSRIARKQINNAPRFAGMYEAQASSGVRASPALEAMGNPIAAPPPLPPGSGAPADTYGTMPPAGGPTPLGELRDEYVLPKPDPVAVPSFGFAGARMGGLDANKNRQIDVAEALSKRQKQDLPPSNADFSAFRNARESAQEKAMLFDTETRFDRETEQLDRVGLSIQPTAETAPMTVNAVPAPKMAFETTPPAEGVAGGMGGGGGIGGIQDHRRMFKLNTATAADDALGTVTSRRSGRGGQAGGQGQGLAQAWGRNQSGQAGAEAAESSDESRALGLVGGAGRARPAKGLTDGFGLSADKSSGRSSSSRSKFVADKKERDEELAEMESRERELVRELAQKKKSLTKSLAKKAEQANETARQPVRFAQKEAKELPQQVVDLQARIAPVQLKTELQATPARLEAEQRGLAAVAGRPSSTRGVQGAANAGNDYGLTPARRGELRAKEGASPPASGPAPARQPAGFTGIDQNRSAGAQNYLWFSKADQSVPDFGDMPNIGKLFAAESKPAASSGSEEERLTRRGWAYRADADDDGLVRGRQVEASVDELFLKIPTDRSGSQPGSDAEGRANLGFDNGAVIAGDLLSRAKKPPVSVAKDPSRRYFRQIGDRNAPPAFRRMSQDGKAADKPASAEDLNLNVLGQSPASSFDTLERSDTEIGGRGGEAKKRLADTLGKQRASTLQSDLGRSKAVLGGDFTSASVNGIAVLITNGVTGGIVAGVNDSGVDRSRSRLERLVTDEDTDAKTSDATIVAGIVPATPGLVASGTFIPSQRSEKYYITNSSLAALLPPSTPVTLKEEIGESEEQKPAPVRPKKPKTLKPKPEVLTKDNAFSTFSLNVSDVAFKLAAASLKEGKLPDPETVRSEEFLNALDYHDPAPRGNERLAFAWDRARNPFAHNRDFLRFSIQTAARGRESGQPLNLVVLLDASGSMERADRVKIVRQMLAVLADQLKPADKISVVAFARTPWLLVDGMKGGKPKELLERVINITPQGGTNIEVGLEVAYLIARRHYLPDGNNRVIILTDGAANLGNVDPEALKAKVEDQRKKNIALDCFGVGWEGYNDDLLETLSRNGDGRYGFINDPAEARNGFANLLAGALQVAAANVKAQIQFNPKRVTSYRQIGYNKHQLKKEQFRDNTVDAAEIGAAESGTAMYSIQTDRQGAGPLATVRVRYKIPATGRYVEEEWELPYDPASQPLESAQPSMRLAGVAASFAEWMAANPHAGSVSLRDLERYLTGVPEEFSSDERPKQLRTMLQQARRISGE